ncbi:hypothetical protein BDA96_10G337200 [Sorghum bicolor]|uniref:Uncharacterized protein n=1 Tax=Sorghum bicolor TaxID=4558 RepID=A0A921Q8D4_SORBI|nr:hypothetical protein BDA96_10G337200 [Sorghum bicolor]
MNLSSRRSITHSCAPRLLPIDSALACPCPWRRRGHRGWPGAGAGGARAARRRHGTCCPHGVRSSRRRTAHQETRALLACSRAAWGEGPEGSGQGWACVRPPNPNYSHAVLAQKLLCRPSLALALELFVPACRSLLAGVGRERERERDEKLAARILRRRRRSACISGAEE